MHKSCNNTFDIVIKPHAKRNPRIAIVLPREQFHALLSWINFSNSKQPFLRGAICSPSSDFKISAKVRTCLGRSIVYPDSLS